MQVKTKNLLIGAVIVALVGMLWYRVVYSPMQAKASKATAAARAADTQSAGLRRTLTGSSPGDKHNPKSVSTQSLLAAIPADPAEASFLRSLDELRISSGAAWQTIAPGVPGPSSSGASITVTITASGTEDQVARYLVGLTTLKRVFVIDNVAIAPDASKTVAGPPAQPQSGALFGGGLEQATISGRIFTSASVTSPTATPTTAAPVPTAKTNG